MSGTSNGRGIRIAIAVSLAVHLIIATLVHPRRVNAQPPEKPSPATIIHLIPPKPSPTPRVIIARNRIRQAPHTQARRPHVTPPHTSPHNDGKSVAIAISSAAPGTPAPPDPDASPGPDAGPTLEPSLPTPTPKPACSAPDVPARTTFVQSPSASDSATQPATAKIRVDLDADGAVRGVSIYESTGSMELDRAALEAARESHYAAEQYDCKNIPGSYLFTVDFGTM